MQNDSNDTSQLEALPLAGQLAHTCEACQKVRWFWPSQLIGRRFCSRKCKGVYAKLIHPKKTCLQCKQEFHDLTAPRFTRRRRYCSKQCYNLSIQADEKNCRSCDKSFKVSPSGQSGENERHHCSDKCRSHSISLRMFSLDVAPIGTCRLCGIAVGPKRLLCRKCHHTRKSKAEKVNAMAAYGGKCACCGESNLAFLTLDHVNNDGASHRRKLMAEGSGHALGVGFYAILRRRGYPNDPPLQVLCWNCNCAKQYYKHCPHQAPLPDWIWSNTLLPVG